MREIGDRNILDKFCEDFCKIVERHCKYIIVSDFVAISSGRARATEDIDMIIERMGIEKFKELHNDLVSHGFECMQSADPDVVFEYLKEKGAVRYTYKDEPLPEMEVKFCKDELDDFQIATRVKLDLTGLDIWFSSIEMNIAFKEELLKSDKDMKDAEHLRKVYDVDENSIAKIKKMIRKLRL